MSAFRDPVGPQSKRVYWRRRAVVGLGALAIIVAIVLIIVRPSFSASAPDPSQSPSAPPPAAEAQTASGGPAQCTAEQVEVTAVTDADAYDPDVAPQLAWTARNVGGAACVLDVGTAHQVFTITSGSETIWTSSDCQADRSDYPLTLEPGGEPAESVSIPWSRERSSSDTCGEDVEREKVAGEGASYHLTVSVGGIESTDSRQFLLY